MTVTFQPAFGVETIFWRSNGTPIVGPVSNPNALPTLPVYLIFSGSSWSKATAATYASAVKTILVSSYLSGLRQYGASGTATYGGYVIDNRPSAGRSGRDSVTQFVLDQVRTSWPKPTGVAPPNGAYLGSASYLLSPIYVVIDDLNAGGANNGGGVYTAGGKTYLTNGISINSTTAEDNVAILFSHEIVERISDGNGLGIGMNAPQNVANNGQWQNAQLADNEPDGGRYTYRLTRDNHPPPGGAQIQKSGVLVQAYWSVVDQKFIIPDGNRQTVFLTPIWNSSTSFTGTFNLLAVLADQGPTAPTGSLINASKTVVTLGNETFGFAGNSIQQVAIFSLTTINRNGQVWLIGGPGTKWSAISGVNTNVLRLVTDGLAVFMLANNGDGNRVWQYSGSGVAWTAITSATTFGAGNSPWQLVVSGSRLCALVNSVHDGGWNQIYEYGGAGGNWTAITGTNTSIFKLAAPRSGLFMLADNANGEGSHVWQYNGSGKDWTAVTGIGTIISQLVECGGELYMLADNAGTHVWRYSGLGIDWVAITGANTIVSELVECGGELYMLANNGDGNRVWQHHAAGWKPITKKPLVYQIVACGGTLYMLADDGDGKQVWQYSGVAAIGPGEPLAGVGWAAITGANTTVYSISSIGNSLSMSAANAGGPPGSWQYSGAGTTWTLA